MVLRELLGQADLSEAQTLCIHETMEVIVVRKDKNLILAIFQIVTPRLKDLDDSQKFTVVGLISSLCRNHFSRKEGYEILLAQIGLSDYLIWASSGS